MKGGRTKLNQRRIRWPPREGYYGFDMGHLAFGTVHTVNGKCGPKHQDEIAEAWKYQDGIQLGRSGSVFDKFKSCAKMRISAKTTRRK
jgi:hypothetical protein